MNEVKPIKIKRCPRCGSQLIHNGKHVWCTFVGSRREGIPACSFGCYTAVTFIELMRGTAK